MSTENSHLESTLTLKQEDPLLSQDEQPSTCNSTPPPETPNGPDTPTNTVTEQDLTANDLRTEEQVAQDSAEKTAQSIQTNQDYQSVLKVLNILKHQLERANKDIETLTRMKKEALDDPFRFVLDLKSKKKLKRRPPPLQRILSVPELDWTKYRFVPESRFARQTASLAALTHQYTYALKRPGMYKSVLDNPSAMEQGTIRPPGQTSREARMLQREIAKGLESVGGTVPSRAGSVAAASDGSDEEEDERSAAPLIGKSQRRVSSQTGPAAVAEKSIPLVATAPPAPPPAPPAPTLLERPWASSPSNNDMKPTPPAHEVPTHNQPWTDEEQQRLEQLLEIYPDEPVQAQRFNKIAQALGTRTARQVGSRIQKYFIKLAKMGLPVPGRVNIPSSKPMVKPSRGRGGRAKMRGGGRTKAAGYNTMISGGLTNTKISGGYYSSSIVPSVYMSEDEEMDDNVNKTMRRVAQPDKDGDPNTTVIHEGFACDSCGVEPIVGVLYKCTVCDEAEEVDLCSKCMALGTFTNDQHSLDHTFEAVQTAAAPYYADNDYASPEHLGEYSYLGF